MMRRLYDRTLSLAGKRHALWILGGISFAESSVFPVPPDILIVPMVLARRERAWLIAGICTITSVAGGLASYAIGYFFFEAFGHALLDFYGYMDKFESYQTAYNEWGAWIVAVGGLTPFPYKLITIASGVTRLDLVVFIAASLFARGVRFFAVAGLLWYFGERLRGFIERYLVWVVGGVFLLVVGGFLFARFAF